MSTDSDDLVYDGEYPGRPPAEVSGRKCFIKENYFYATGLDRSIWYVDVATIQNAETYLRLDLSDVFVGNNGAVQHLLQIQDYILAADSSNLALIGKNHLDEWELIDSFRLLNVSQEFSNSEGFVNIVDIDYWDQSLIVSDNATGRLYEFVIEENKIVFAGSFDATPVQQEGSVALSINSSAVLRNMLIANGSEAFSIFVREPSGLIVRAVDVPHDGRINNIYVYDDLILGGTESLMAFRVLGCELDSDADGLLNCIDTDDDNDGVDDDSDAFPLDPTESVDTDGDGIGNNADTDDDNDGVDDDSDAFPLDPTESVDTDGDGIGNNADPDDDNDGVEDSSDAFPLDPNESVDTDGDGIGNNADPDDDNDGVNDSSDAFPLDSTESVDTDGDGIGNNADPDDDNDGVNDSSDAFPLDPTESVDTDGDGIGNNADPDDDNDGVDDSSDAFPLDPSRSSNQNSFDENQESSGGSIGWFFVLYLGLLVVVKSNKFQIPYIR